MDFSRSALETCANNPLLKGRTDLILGDAGNLPFTGNSYDAILAHHIMGHSLISLREAIAEEVCRILKPGGILSFRDFSVRDMRRGTGTCVEEMTYLRGNGIITHYFEEQEVISLFGLLTPVCIRETCWKTRIKGGMALRAEIVATFSKSD